jgi:hypothetical protein
MVLSSMCVIHRALQLGVLRTVVHMDSGRLANLLHSGGGYLAGYAGVDQLRYALGERGTTRGGIDEILRHVPLGARKGDSDVTVI